MIPDSHAKSYLSELYVKAVATQAGFTCQFNDHDYGIDGTISEVQEVVNVGYLNTGVHFNVQIKASFNYKKLDDNIVYQLSSDARERLLRHSGGLIVLVLFCSPKEPIHRLDLTEDRLEVRNCSYWYRVTSADRTTLRIPRSQLFDIGACAKLVADARSRAWTV